MSYFEISLTRLALAALFIVVAVFLSWREKLDLEKDLAWGALRAAVQLIAIGYVLVFLFRDPEQPALIFLALAVMLGTAAATSARRVEHGPPWRVLFPRALLAIGAGAVVALVPVFAAIVRPEPWYEARYLIPIGGMMLSNSMNTVALVFERIFTTARAEAPVVEQMLALGATDRQAIAPYVRATVRAAMIPTINGLVTVGLVALPGMMTGQILSGTKPDQAVRYQLVIMYQLVAVAAVSGVVAALLARRLLFTKRMQLTLP
jgi:putative ABC transport system permease protein